MLFNLFRDGYKWLVKSIIASYLDLGDRVARDIETEKKAEEERRKEARRRIEERGKTEDNNESVGNGNATQDKFDPPGFVPVEQLRAKWDASHDASSDISETKHEEPTVTNSTISSDTVETLSAKKLVEKLELEPLSGPKKKGLLSKLNKFTNGGHEVRSIDSRLSGK